MPRTRIKEILLKHVGRKLKFAAPAILLYCDGGGEKVVTRGSLQAFKVINHSGELCNGLICLKTEYIGSFCKLHIIFTSNRRREKDTSQNKQKN